MKGKGAELNMPEEVLREKDGACLVRRAGVEASVSSAGVEVIEGVGNGEMERTCGSTSHVLSVCNMKDALSSQNHILCLVLVESHVVHVSY